MKMTRAFLSQLLAWSIGGFVVGFTLSDAIHGLRPPRLAPSRAAIQSQTAGPGHQFASDAGIMLKFIKPDKTTDFEATVNKVKEALAKSRKPERRQQALSWRVFKAVERATNGDVVYVFEIDPAVRGADYTVSRILEEGFPTEARSLYRRYADSSSSRQHIVDLKLIAEFGDRASR